MSVPKQPGGLMSERTAWLRRERGGPRPSRRRLALACAAIALASPAFANAESLRPDPPSGPTPAELQPDAFPGAAQPTSAPVASPQVTPVPGVEAVPTLRGPLATKPSRTAPPAAPKIEPVAPRPSIATHPVVATPMAPKMESAAPGPSIATHP